MAKKPLKNGSQPPRGLRFTEIHVENWRNFTKAHVALQSRAFLVGPNAAGKSNFLDVFRFLHDIASVGGGLQAAVGDPQSTSGRAGVSKIRALAARRHSDIAIRTVLGTTQEPRRWEYHLRFNQDSAQRPVVKEERVVRCGEQILERPDRDDEDDPERLSQTHLEQVNVNKDFREVAAFFASVRYLHIVPQLVRDPDRSVGRSNDPFGGDFLEQVARTQVNTQKARLRRIRDALRIAVPQLSDLELWRDARGTPHVRGKYEHWRSKGAWQEERQFSDGTLRLMGLLWAVLDGSGPLLLEEPELSLHPEVVRYLPQMFARIQRRGGRQILVSTHSGDLLTDEGIGLDEVLLLIPTEEGTEIRSANTFEDVQQLLDGGLTLAEAILPRTSPDTAHQLSLFAQ